MSAHTPIESLGRSLTSPLNKLPGPWYAPLTTLHLRYAFARGTIWKMVERNHKIYGPVVRLGPRQIWISEKAAMRSILQNIDLPKVQMYAEISRDPLSPGLFGEVYDHAPFCLLNQVSVRLPLLT